MVIPDSANRFWDVTYADASHARMRAECVVCGATEFFPTPGKPPTNPPSDLALGLFLSKVVDAIGQARHRCEKKAGGGRLEAGGRS